MGTNKLIYQNLAQSLLEQNLFFGNDLHFKDLLPIQKKLTLGDHLYFLNREHN